MWYENCYSHNKRRHTAISDSSHELLIFFSACLCTVVRRVKGWHEYELEFKDLVEEENGALCEFMYKLLFESIMSLWLKENDIFHHL